MVRRYKVLVGGEWVGDDRPGVEVINPYDDSVVGIVPEATVDDVDRAIESARKGFAIMAVLPAYRRAEILLRASDFIARDREEITEIYCEATGRGLYPGYNQSVSGY